MEGLAVTIYRSYPDTTEASLPSEPFNSPCFFASFSSALWGTQPVHTFACRMTHPSRNKYNFRYAYSRESWTRLPPLRIPTKNLNSFALRAGAAHHQRPNNDSLKVTSNFCFSSSYHSPYLPKSFRYDILRTSFLRAHVGHPEQVQLHVTPRITGPFVSLVTKINKLSFSWSLRHPKSPSLSLFRFPPPLFYHFCRIDPPRFSRLLKRSIGFFLFSEKIVTIYRFLDLQNSRLF